MTKPKAPDFSPKSFASTSFGRNASKNATAMSTVIKDGKMFRKRLSAILNPWSVFFLLAIKERITAASVKIKRSFISAPNSLTYQKSL